MSRIGRKPIPVPGQVEVTLADGGVRVKGPAGELRWAWHPNVKVAYDEAAREITVERNDDQRFNRALHGLSRSLIANMVEGVVNPFQKKLEIIGVGYNAALAGDSVKLNVGYANTVVMKIPEGVTCEVPDATHVIVKSPNKQAVGQFAAEIRRVRPPEPYKGKGIRYDGEFVRRKAGKALAGG
ncbi:MAG: 50S ribosomal protein L6 [Planctomycetaceae bacterium]